MKSNRSLIYDGFRIAMAYVGTVVGAGFATGQEIIQFFTCYGYSSFWAILISVILFIAAGRKIMHFGRKLNARSYGSLTEYLFGNAAPFVNIYLGLTFVFICGAMFAGAGALFKEQLSIPLRGRCFDYWSSDTAGHLVWPEGNTGSQFRYCTLPYSIQCICFYLCIW